MSRASIGLSGGIGGNGNVDVVVDAGGAGGTDFGGALRNVDPDCVDGGGQAASQSESSVSGGQAITVGS